MATTLTPLEIQQLLLQGEDIPTPTALRTPTRPLGRREFDPTKADADLARYYQQVVVPQQQQPEPTPLPGTPVTLPPGAAQTPSVPSSGFGARVMENVGSSVIEQQRAELAGQTAAAEAALQLGTGIAGLGIGAVSTLGELVAGSGPVTGLTINELRPELQALGQAKGSDYFKTLYERTHAIAQRFTYQPRTPLGQATGNVVSSIFEPLSEFSRIAADAPLARIALTDDQRYAVRFAHELLTMAAIDVGIRGVLGSHRASTAKVRNEFAKMVDEPTSDGSALVDAAQKLTTQIQNDPAATAELQAARQRLTGTLQEVADAPVRRLDEALRTREQQLEPSSETQPTGGVVPEPSVATGTGSNVSNVTETTRPTTVSEEGVPVVDTTPAIAKPTRVSRKKITEQPPPESAPAEVTPPAQTPAPSQETATSAGAVLSPSEEALMRSNIKTSNTVQIIRERASTPEGRAQIIEEYDLTPYLLNRSTRGLAPEEVAYQLRNKIPGGMTASDSASLIREAIADAQRKLPLNERLFEAQQVQRIAEQVGRDIAERPDVLTPQVTYETVAPSTLATVLDRGSAGSILEPRLGANLQVRRLGDAPDALLVDTRGLNTSTALETIRKDVAARRTSPEVAAALEANLQRQADAFGVSIERAHQFNADTLMRQAMEIANERGLELYQAKRTKTGIEYEQIPPETIRTILKIDSDNVLQPLSLTKEEASTYVQEKTKPVGALTVEEIARAMETGDTSILDRLPADIRPFAQELIEQSRSGVDHSEVRRFMEILQDVADALLPGDVPPGQLNILGFFGLTPKRQAAARRLRADAIKAGINLKEAFRKLTDIPEAEKTLMLRYLDSIDNSLQSPILEGINPRNVALDPEAIGRGDRIVSQRKFRRDGVEYEAPPVYESEAAMMYNSKDIRAQQGTGIIGGIELGSFSVELPYYSLRRAGLLDLHRAYEAVERGRLQEMRTVNKDLNALERGFSKESKERITQYGYGESEQGMRLLERNNKDIPNLTPDERTVYSAMRRAYDVTLDRINDVRRAIGKEPIERVDDYIPFMRTFTTAEKLERGMNLVTSDAAEIMQYARDHMNIPFVRERTRTGATYTAEFDSFKIFRDYMRSATEQIHRAPFIAKLEELINHPLPDPGTGAKTWSLAERRPGVHEMLQQWKNFLTTGVETKLPKRMENIVRGAMENLTFAQLGFNIRSTAVQATTLRGTVHAIGPKYTAEGIAKYAEGAVSSALEGQTPRQFALEKSRILDTRGFQETANDVASAIIGRSPKAFYEAMKSGQFRELQKTLGASSLEMLGFFDKEAAIMSWLGAYEFATKKLRYKGIDAYNYADGVVVRTQGSSLPGDVAPLQRTLGGQVFTQFQRFVISDANYLIEDVFGARGKREIAAKLERDPNKYAPAVVKSILGFVAATTAFNVLLEDVVGINSPFPTPIRDFVRNYRQGQEDSPMGLAGRLAGGVVGSLVEPVPVIGSARYGRGLGGPVRDVLEDTTDMLRGDPLSYQPLKPGDDASTAAARLYGSPPARLLGVPGSGQVGKTVRGLDREKSVYNSLTGYYEQSSEGGQRTRRSTGGLRRIR